MAIFFAGDRADEKSSPYSQYPISLRIRSTTCQELREWQTLANKELSRREKTVDALVKQTAEGIDVKPLYTEADLDNLK